MPAHTILNLKTDKKLKADAQSLAQELGVPLSTVMNAFLKQFVREREFTLSANEYRATPYLEQILEEAKSERKTLKPMDGASFIKQLKKL